MTHRIVALAVVALAFSAAGCTQRASAPEAAPPAAALAMGCEAPFVQNASAETMREAFGAENVTEETVPGPEGTENVATVLFADDPARRVEILWADAATRSGLMNASVQGEASVWTGPKGVRIGSGLAAVEAANEGAFKLAGFQWDFAGVVTDWSGGAFAPTANGCAFGVQFAPPQDADPAIASEVAGDQSFSSDLPAMRTLAPTVVRMAVGYPAAPAAPEQP